MGAMSLTYVSGVPGVAGVPGVLDAESVVGDVGLGDTPYSHAALNAAAHAISPTHTSPRQIGKRIVFN